LSAEELDVYLKRRGERNDPEAVRMRRLASESEMGVPDSID
jgi:hypothetical protein